MKRLLLAFVLSGLALGSGSAFAKGGGFGSSHSGSSTSLGSARPFYSGGSHITSHGGTYPGGEGSSHKGGTYDNPASGDRYGIHQGSNGTNAVPAQ